MPVNSPVGARVALYDAGATLTNQNALTTMLANGAVANGWPAFQAVGDMMRVCCRILWTNNTGAGQTATVALIYGSTTVFTATTASETANSNVHRGLLDVSIICSSLGASGAFHYIGHWISPIQSANAANAVLTAGTVSSATDMISLAGSVTSVATNAAQSFDLKGNTSTSTATGTLQAVPVALTYIPFLGF